MRIPRSRKSFSCIPTPTSRSSRATARPAISTTSSPGGQVTDQGDGRVDYRLSDKDSLFGSLSWSNTGKTSGSPFPGPLDGADFNGAQETDLSRNAQISYTRVWSPTLISETRVGFTRLVTSRLGANPTADQFQQFGIGGYNPTGATANNGGLAADQHQRLPADRRERLDSDQGIQQRLGFRPERRHQQGFALPEVRRRIPSDQVPVLPGSRPARQHRLQREPDGLPDAANNQSGDAIASALLGQIDSGNISTTNFVSSQKVAYAGYAQDDWKVTPEADPEPRRAL